MLVMTATMTTTMTSSLTSSPKEIRKDVIKVHVLEVLVSTTRTTFLLLVVSYTFLSCLVVDAALFLIT